MKNKQDWEKVIEEIMQDGFDVAMFGDPFMDNVREKQEKEYNRIVKKHSKYIQKQITKAREEAVKDFVGFCLSRDLRPETKGFFMCEKQLYLKSLEDKK